MAFDYNSYKRQWNREHPEKLRQYYLTRKASGKPTGGGQPSPESKRRYLQNHPDARRATVLKNRQIAKQNLLDFFGHKCAHCGYAENDCALQLHHVNNDGKRDRCRGVESRWREIRDNPEVAKQKYQLLCANCHCVVTFADDVWRLGRKIGGANQSVHVDCAGEEVPHGQQYSQQAN